MAASPSNAAGLSLDQLIALNDEIAALVRSGVPLNQGLLHLGGDLPGRLGRLVAMLAERLDRGESLADIMADPSLSLPPAYRTVVEAGLSSGRLAAALEAVAASSRRLAEMRRFVAASFVYPLIVLLVAWAMFLFLTVVLAPGLARHMAGFPAPLIGVLEGLARLGQWAHVWGWTAPLLILLLAAVWWYRSGRAAAIGPAATSRLFGWMPWLGAAQRSAMLATFAELLALMVEHSVPLPRAVRLAGEAAGDRWLNSASANLAAALERGEAVDARNLGVQFPPLLRWLIITGQSRGALLPALRHAAESYHRRAQSQAIAAQTLLPILLLLGIGGTATLTYAVLVFAPWYSMLWHLSR